MRHEVLNGIIIDLIPGENIIRRDYTLLWKNKVQVILGKRKSKGFGKGQ